MGKRLGFEGVCQASKRIILGSICRFSWISSKYLFLYKKKTYYIKFQPSLQISWEFRKAKDRNLFVFWFEFDLRTFPVYWSFVGRWGHLFLPIKHVLKEFHSLECRTDFGDPQVRSMPGLWPRMRGLSPCWEFAHPASEKEGRRPEQLETKAEPGKKQGNLIPNCL